jgi:hypothetical protein
MPFRRKLQRSFFEETVADTAYLTMMGDNITPCISILFSDEDCYYQHDGAPAHYLTSVRKYIDVHFLGRWIRWSVEYPLNNFRLLPVD